MSCRVSVSAWVRNAARTPWLGVPLGNRLMKDGGMESLVSIAVPGIESITSFSCTHELDSFPSMGLIAPGNEVNLSCRVP